MSHPAELPAPPVDADDPRGRLAAYLARTQTPLDLLALVTLWIVIVPPGDFGPNASVALAVRISLSVVYAIDMTIRTTLAPRHGWYLRHHLLGLAVVVIPPLRVIFSVRLVRSFFQRGHLSRFLLAATILVLNGAIAVYFYERHAHGSNIRTLRESVWWAITTVSTVGYGDFFPVTGLGQIAAAFIMAIGILTLAVVTAQVSSSFVEQAARRRASEGSAQSDPAAVPRVDVPLTVPRADVPLTVPRADVTLADLAERLARIEAHLGTDRGSPAPGA